MGAVASAVSEELPFDPDSIPTDGVKVSYLNEFLEAIGGREKLEGLTTTKVNEQFQMPITAKTKSSMCQLLKHINHPAVGESQVFISHAWRYNFLNVIDALLYHFRNEPDTIIWFDVFSNNQHKIGNLEYDFFETNFRENVDRMKRTVLVSSPWNNPIPYTRAWCIFEMYATAITNSTFEIAMSDVDKKQFIEDIEEKTKDTMNKMLSVIDAKKSECWKSEDRVLIFKAIENSVGFGKINEMVFEQLRDFVIAEGKKALDENTDESRISSLKNMLGELYQGQGKYEHAISLFEDSWKTNTEQKGEKNQDTLRSMSNFADTLRCQGKYDLALPLSQDCLAKREETLGESHPDTLTSLNNLAILYDMKGKYDLAESFYVKCLAKREETLGESHPDTLRTKRNYEICLEEKQQRAEQANT